MIVPNERLSFRTGDGKLDNNNNKNQQPSTQNDESQNIRNKDTGTTTKKCRKQRKNRSYKSNKWLIEMMIKERIKDRKEERINSFCIANSHE